MNLGILVLLVAIILFGLLAFRGISALILAPLVTCFVLILSPIFAGTDIAILDGLKTQFMPAAAKYVSDYFLVFFMAVLIYLVDGGARDNVMELVSQDDFPGLPQKRLCRRIIPKNRKKFGIADCELKPAVGLFVICL